MADIRSQYSFQLEAQMVDFGIESHRRQAVIGLAAKIKIIIENAPDIVCRLDAGGGEIIDLFWGYK